MNLPELAIALALAWGAGLRAYLVVFAVGIAGALGWVELPGHLDVLQHPLVIGASGFMALVEFGADKLPWLDSVWDAVHSFVRIPAGAALAAMGPIAWKGPRWAFGTASRREASSRPWYCSASAESKPKNSGVQTAS